jgi:hypothetical protein
MKPKRLKDKEFLAMHVTSKEMATECGIGPRMVNLIAARARLKRIRGKLDREAFLAARARYINPVKVRDALLGIGPELRDRLAQESDPIRCDEMVTNAITAALRGIAEFRPPKACETR